VPPYTELPGCTICDITEAILMMLPRLRASRPGRAACVSRVGATTFSLISRSRRSMSALASAPSVAAPALLIRRLMLASSRKICSTRFKSAPT